MKKLIISLAVLLLTATVVKAEFLGGFIYNGATTPGGGYTNAAATKQEALLAKIFGISFQLEIAA